MNSSNLILRRTELYLTEGFVWVDIPSSDGFNLLQGDKLFVIFGSTQRGCLTSKLLKGNVYFSPDTTADTLKWYFGYLEHVLNSHSFRVLLLGDFIILYLISV